MKRFGRRYRLVVGNKKESLVIDQLRIAFDCTKTIKSDPNPATVMVYNLSETTRDRIISGEFKFVRFEAGYEELGLLFMGDIINPVIRKEGADIITEIQVADGFKAITESVSGVTVKSGSTNKDIVNQVAKTMGDTQVSIADVDTGSPLPRGKVLNGDSRFILNQVAKDSNADWSIQDGNLIVLPKDKVLPSGSGFVISQETGMIGSPEKSDSGMELVYLLEPKIVIGSLIRVESILKQYNGDYKVTDIRMTGDTHGDTWYSHITCIGGKFQNAKK